MQIYSIISKGRRLKFVVCSALELWKNNNFKKEIFQP